MIHIVTHEKQKKNTYAILREIKSWILQHIHRPIRGFEHKKNPDGSWFSKKQQIDATRHQALTLAHYFVNRGKSYDEIVNVLQLFR